MLGFEFKKINWLPTFTFIIKDILKNMEHMVSYSYPNVCSRDYHHQPSYWNICCTSPRMISDCETICNHFMYVYAKQIILHFITTIVCWNLSLQRILTNTYGMAIRTIIRNHCKLIVFIMFCQKLSIISTWKVVISTYFWCFSCDC